MRKTAPTTATKAELHENTIYRMQLEILQANPLGNVIKLAQGVSIPGIPAPTPTQVEAANYALLRRIMPELKSVTVRTTGGDDGNRDIVRELASFIGSVAALKAGGGTLPPLLDHAGESEPAEAAD